MSRNEFNISDWFSDTKVTEPLKTFRDNSRVVVDLYFDISRNIETKKSANEEIKGKIERSITENEELSSMSDNNYERALDNYNSLKETVSKVTGDTLEQVRTLITEGEKLIDDTKNTKVEVQAACAEDKSLHASCLEFINEQQEQIDTLRPMVFIYFVTIWQAFILDTIKKYSLFNQNNYLVLIIEILQ